MAAGLTSTTLSGWPVEPPALDWVHGEPSAPADRETEQALQPATHADLAAWLDRFASARVQAMRITSPDLQAQFGQLMRRPIDTVLCSVLDVDPSACLNSVVAATYPRELHAAVKLLGELTGAPQRWVVVDDRVPAAWWSPIRRKSRSSGVRLIPLHHDYPQADPTVLLYSLLSRRLRPGRLPVEQGVLLLDAVAAVALGRCALLGESMDRTPVALRDHVRGRAHYCVVGRGASLATLLQQCAVGEEMMVRASDVLRDLRVEPQEIIDSGELVFHASAREIAINPDPCIRCGWCIDSCPTRLYPAMVLDAAQRDDFELAQRAGIEACIECGVCAYVCPSRLPLLVGIRKLRAGQKEMHVT